MPYLLSIDYGELFFPVVISLIVWCFLIRWAVRADSIVKNQQAMIWFLILMCKRNGATDEEINKIKEHYDIK